MSTYWTTLWNALLGIVYVEETRREYLKPGEFVVSLDRYRKQSLQMLAKLNNKGDTK